MSAIAIPSVRPSVSPDAVTPEDLLKMEDDGLFELVDGRLVEKKMAYTANEIAGEIIWSLKGFLKEMKFGGSVLPEQSFQCFPHKPSQIRRPDVAFIAPSRVPAVRPEGHVKIAPDLAVEVISPNDSVYELDEKLADYRQAGVPLIWVVNPDARHIRVHRSNQPIDELHDGDLLRGDPVLPGFSVKVTDLLPTIKKDETAAIAQ